MNEFIFLCPLLLYFNNYLRILAVSFLVDPFHYLNLFPLKNKVLQLIIILNRKNASFRISHSGLLIISSL